MAMFSCTMIKIDFEWTEKWIDMLRAASIKNQFMRQNKFYNKKTSNSIFKLKISLEDKFNFNQKVSKLILQLSNQFWPLRNG